MRRAVRFLALTAATAALSSTASAYYFYVHYLSRGTFQPTVEKFDLGALQNKSVPFLISNQPPALAAGDSFPALISQIRLAASVWSDVESSDLRLAFGGLFGTGTQHSGPVIEVVFGEVPPGLIAATVAELRPEVSPGLPPGIAAVPVEPFIPIVKSMVVLDRDQSRTPSWTEAFFLTVTHEFGHALGLQHSFCSGVMSTEVTRATTKAQPLALDDIVGVSVLYPARPLSANNGSISGRVTIGSTGVNLASVVALSPEGAAISTLTAPDGSYRIDGVPSGSYYLYVHPLPPRVSGEAEAGGITPPLDATGQAIPFRDNFEAVLYPNARSLDRAAPVLVTAGTSTVGINFSVTRRASPPALFGVATYGFPGQVAVRPAHVHSPAGAGFAVAAGYGLTARVSASVIGQGLTVSDVRAYAPDPRFVRFDFQSTAGAEGPRHLVLSTETEFYVLPGGVRLTRRLPPGLTIAGSSTDASGARILSITGQNLGADTQILFDGIPGTIRQTEEGQLSVVPPAAPSGHRAAVIALNRDGQSSLFLQTPAPLYEFEGNGEWNFSVTPNQIPSGIETLVEVLGTNANFVTGQTVLTFGSSTIHVRRLWVVGPNRLLANVLVPAGTQPGTMSVTAGTGLRVLEQANGFSVTPANPRAISLRSPVTDAGAGSLSSVRLVGDATAASLQVTVNDRPGTVVSLAGGILTFRLPAGLAAGPGILRVSSGTDAATIGMTIEAAPPAVSAAAAAGTRIDETRPARPGEVLSLSVSGLADNAAEITPSRVTVLVGGSAQPILGVSGAAGGGHNVQFQLDARTATGNHPLIVSIDGRASAEFILPVRAN